MRQALIMCGSLLAYLFASRGYAEPLPSRPNIIVILMDDLGYGDVSYMNEGSKIKTPNLDALAAEGVYLTDAHSPSAVCSPTRYAVLTGRYAWRNPRLRRGLVMPWDEPVIEPTRVAIPALLKQVGYATACIGKWHLGFHWPWKDGFSPVDARLGVDSIASNRMFDWTKPISGGPLAIGFDYYFGDAVPNFPPFAFIENSRLVGRPVDLVADELESIGFRGRIHGDGPGISGWRFDQIMPRITSKAVEYIEKRSSDDGPFFLWFATASPHTPVVPTKEFQGKSAAGHYGDYVVQTDDSVGQIVRALKKNNLFDNTLLIVTSDNGPSALVQSVIQTHDHTPAGPLRGMKWDTWEGGHRVPLVASWPRGGIRLGARIDELVSLVDIYDTLAFVAGVASRDSVDSLNVIDTLRGKGPVRTEMVYHSGGGHLGLRRKDWVLLEGSGGMKEPPWRRDRLGIRSPDATIQLFNLSDDLSQRENVASKHPELVREMSARLSSIVRGPPPDLYRQYR